MVVNLMENVFPGVQQIKAAVRTAVDTTPCHHPPHLSIQSAGATTNLVTLHGARGRSYALESSGDLTTWTNYLICPARMVCGKSRWLPRTPRANSSARKFCREPGIKAEE
jgi:hypothetical protein